MRRLAKQKKSVMQILKISLIAIALTITGCSSGFGIDSNKPIELGKPKIHLYLYGQVKSSSDKYIEVLRDAGYEVALRTGELPTDETKSFIIHSPGINSSHYSDIQNIVELLQSVGINEIVEYQYSRGKHSYTQRHVGVYLL